MKLPLIFSFAAATGLLVLPAQAANVTIAPLTSFGGGDGWVAPGDTPYVTTGNTERGMAYNPVTGNLLLVSRANPTGTDGNNIRIMNGLTGADTGGLDKGTGVISGGTFAVNSVGVAADGAIFVNNLTTNTSTSPLKIYLWPSEAATPGLAVSYSGAAIRLGDDIDVKGSGTSTLLAAGYSGTGPAVAIFSTTSGTTFTGSDVTVPGVAAGDFRLGITFTDGTNLFGSQGTAPKSIDYLAGTLNGTLTPADSNERPMDYAVVGGVPLLATIQTNSNLVRVYDLTTGLFVSLNNTSLPTPLTAPNANGNGSGAVAFGAISGNTVNLYAMNSNNGIQAFTVTVPEPSMTVLLGAVAGLGLLRRRRA